jgi:hypothetical protein
MLDRPHLIKPRALRFPEVLPTPSAVPRLWPNLPVTTQMQVARQLARMLRGMKTPRSQSAKEGSDADHDDGI